MSSNQSDLLQAAAVPFREGRVCLVTSRRTGLWILPKGRIDPGHTPEQAAAQEAWEEAGVRGSVWPGSVGAYRYGKNGQAYLVDAFLLVVTDVATDWPERRQRERRWTERDEALALIQWDGLREVVREAFRRMD